MLVESLLTLESVNKWGSFNNQQFYRYFLIPGFRAPPILARARAWDLTIWLEPFIKKIESSKDLPNPRALLSQFAYWVYCSSRYWAEDSSMGLHIKTDRNGKKFAFYPSNKAKTEWLKTIENLGYPPLL